MIRGVERYHGRLAFFSAGNFAGYKNFGTGGNLSLSAIVKVTLRGDGGFVSGRWISVRLNGDVLPELDGSAASSALAASLSRDDFGERAPTFAADGTLSIE